MRSPADPPATPLDVGDTESPPPRAEELNLRLLVSLFVDSRSLILSSLVLAATAACTYLVLATPVYRASALVQVEETVDSREGSGLRELTDMFRVKTAADTEIEILQSRSLLTGVAEALRLDVTASPRKFPVFGGAWARYRDGAEPQPPPLGLSRFAWGGERITVPQLAVATEYEGTPLTLKALGAGAYELRGEAGEVLLQGVVGRPARSTDGQVSIFVSRLSAHPGTEFAVTKVPLDVAVESLQQSVTVAQKGKKTGLITIELSGADPVRTAAIVNAIANAYVRQNVERRSEEAEKTLSFISSQIPQQKANLEAAERALREYRSRHGSVDVSLETSAAIDRVAELERALSELAAQRAELLTRFTSKHNSVVAIDDKAARLKSEITDSEARIRKLPSTELESARLVRDVRVANTLYEILLNKAQELRVVKSGTIGNVRILDAAVLPRKPVRPNPTTALPIALLGGLMIGAIGAVVRKALAHTIEDPQDAQAAARIPVYATVPRSGTQQQLSRQVERLPRRDSGLRVLADAFPDDLAIESIRSLRTSLQFALPATNVVALTGPSPGTGKSFVATNLAHVVAASGQRVVLVDADLRRGMLHRVYGIAERAPGLSEVVSGNVALQIALHEGVGAGVDLLPTGMLPPNPSELLMSGNFRRLVEELSARYDRVILDTPPCLAVTDSGIVARHAGLTLLVLRAGWHTAREVQEAIGRLAQAAVTPRGLVFNDVTRTAGRTRYGSTYAYVYEYTREDAAKPRSVGLAALRSAARVLRRPSETPRSSP